MERHLFGRTDCAGAVVCYYLLEGEDGYGLEVHYRGERLCLTGITVCRARAEALAAALLRGAVTPATARDIVEDWLLA